MSAVPRSKVPAEYGPLVREQMGFGPLVESKPLKPSRASRREPIAVALERINRGDVAGIDQRKLSLHEI
jgi:hypothetical protein